MINLSLYLTNPWANSDYKDMRSTTWVVAKNKSLELEFATHPATIIGLNFDLTFRRDHAGLSLGVALFTKYIGVQFYDHRHWDYSKNDYI
jgi:hypothetical protein